MGRSLVTGARAARSTIALKMLMAVSGIFFIGFVLTHMYGNLKAFAGHDAFNEYAEHLRELGEPMLPHGGALWIMRVGLIIALHRPRLLRRGPVAPGAKGADGQVRRQEAHRCHVRQPDDALGRPHHPAVRRRGTC